MPSRWLSSEERAYIRSLCAGEVPPLPPEDLDERRRVQEVLGSIAATLGAPPAMDIPALEIPELPPDPFQ